MSKPNYNIEGIEDSLMRRLAKEHQRLHHLSTINSDLIEYTVENNAKEYPHPPNEYKIKYKFKSIVGIDAQQMPIYGEGHEMHIKKLPRDYPLQPAVCAMVSPTWHPNIKASGPYEGQICTNTKDAGSLYWLHELVVRIGEYLQYKKYLSENRDPYPEDQDVAKWVREFAEPKGIINKDEQIFVENSPWQYIQLDNEGNIIRTEMGEEEEDLIIVVEEITNGKNVDSSTKSSPEEENSNEEEDDEIIIT